MRIFGKGKCKLIGNCANLEKEIVREVAFGR